MRHTLIRESTPRIQKIVGRVITTSMSPTIEVEGVFDTCWMSRSNETTPPRSVYYGGSTRVFPNQGSGTHWGQAEHAG